MFLLRLHKARPGEESDTVELKLSAGPVISVFRLPAAHHRSISILDTVPITSFV